MCVLQFCFAQVRWKNKKKGKRVWQFKSEVIEKFGPKVGEEMCSRKDMLPSLRHLVRHHPDLDETLEDCCVAVTSVHFDLRVCIQSIHAYQLDALTS
jgi:hypothetical protein